MSYKKFAREIKNSGLEGNPVEYETCHVTGKRCLTYVQARHDLNRYRRHHNINRGKKMPKREYICEFCGYYHLTSSIHRTKVNLYKKTDNR